MHTTPTPSGNDALNTLSPNEADIAAHLHALFSPSFVHPYTDGWIEIAVSHPASGQINDAQNWSAFELKELARFAAGRTAAGYNVYIAPALRQGKQSGRSTREKYLASASAWAEFDGAGDDARINAILKEKQLAPAMIVTTGTVPHLRAHLYFRLKGELSREKLEAANKSLMELLGSDAVQSATHLMRLAGTINYPTQKKLERGYVAELVKLEQREGPAYEADALINLSSAATNPFTEIGNSVGFGGRKDQEILALLEKSRVSNWHNSVRDAIATMVGRGWSESAIRFACAPYCDGGADDPDLTPLIDGALAKFGKTD